MKIKSADLKVKTSLSVRCKAVLLYTMERFCDILQELINITKTANIKIDELQKTVTELKEDFVEVKTSSDKVITKLLEVEAGLSGMDIPAYTGAILQLAKILDKTLQTNAPVQEDLQTKADTFRLDCETETDGAENQSDQGQYMSAHTGVVIVSDMCLTKEHAEYVEKKLNLGRARVINCDSPLTLPKSVGEREPEPLITLQ